MNNFLSRFLSKFKTDHYFKRHYKSYSDYIDHQKEKTNNPEKRAKWLNEEWEPKLNYFKNEFDYIVNSFAKIKTGKGIGLGARTGQEVQAMIDIGFEESVGIDLVECPPLVQKGDIHDTGFEDSYFSFAFSNVYDHALYPEKFIREFARILKPSGMGVLHLQVGMVTDDYGVVDVTSTRTIENYIVQNNCKVVAVESIESRDVIDMTTRIIFIKGSSL